MATTETDATKALLEGADKAPKDELLTRLKRAVTLLKRHDKEKQESLKELEERLRAKGVKSPADMRTVIITADKKEWQESLTFLELIPDELKPVMFLRWEQGAKEALTQKAA